jgi:hypothetical protein
MTEPITPELGALPWKSGRGVKLVRELGYYDAPTSGILRTRWRQYHLFRCLDGAASQHSVWVYAAITRAQARELSRLMGEELHRRMGALLLGAPLTLALAEEDAGVVYRTEIRLVGVDPEPKLAPDVRRRVKEEIEDQASALRGMPIFA